MVLNMAFANNLKQGAAAIQKIRGISINKLHRACSSGYFALLLFII